MELSERGDLLAGPVRAGRNGWRIWKYPVAGLVPLVAYMALFFFLPTAGVLVNAFRSNSGHLSLVNLRMAAQGAYLKSLAVSVELSAISAGIAAVVGLVVVVGIVSSASRLMQRVSGSISAVLANTGGIPLAFAFIATLGNFGIITKLLAGVGFNPYVHGFSLYSLSGLVIVYQYFLVPMMVLVMLPAVEGLRREWSEVAANLGGKRRHFWRYVGLPLLAPTFFSGLLVLFADAFAAYATAAALAGGVIPLVPIEIGNFVSGNVIANQAHLGDALGLEMVVMVIVVAVVYGTVQHRRARWTR
ncbi:MAG: ABC transporter permease [Acidimicrobiales bacterium]